jgi:single-stranded-DNA-specific exonuclease
LKIVERPYSQADQRALERAGVHPVLARVYAARRIRSREELSYDSARLLAPSLLANAEHAAALLADAIAARRRILIVADYDADGATACAVGVRARRRSRLSGARPLRARLRPFARAGGPGRRAAAAAAGHGG